MDNLLHFFIIIPFVTFLISLLLPGRNETVLSRTSYISAGLQSTLAIWFIIAWIIKGSPILNVKELEVYSTDHFSFFIDFYFDKVTAVYLLIGALLTFLITSYSQYYLHREKGYKRFFNTILFFSVGYNIVILSGNLETLFIGWEILGVASFLLIAFYRDRYLPVRNAVKVFSIYRIADVGLILAMWMAHHLFHENVTFAKLLDYEFVEHVIHNHVELGIFISAMIILASIVKSAQLPFSSWLPRAMEGPTPSSAIFYGSLSVHIGVFLLIRTMPFWQHQPIIKVSIAIIGILTALVTTGIARVQSSIKSQIAYASIAQIGLIFVEVSLGWDTIAIIHVAGNAFLRTYQLLVSPSVVTYLIREQFYEFTPEKAHIENRYPSRWHYTLYILSLREWGLDSFLTNILFVPLKKIGDLVSIIPNFLMTMLFVVMGSALFFRDAIPSWLWSGLPLICSIIALIAVLQSFVQRKSAIWAWMLIIFNHLWIALSIMYNEHVGIEYIALYLGGIIVSGVVGYGCMKWLESKGEILDLTKFYGLVNKYPMVAFIFLLSSLGVAGFPITPTFIGEDIAFSFIHEHQFLLASITALSLILDGICIVRIYAKLFLGPNTNAPKEYGFKTS